jgi:transposase
MINERQPELFAGWIEKMLASPVALLVNFAKGLQHDFQAVHAAMTYPWSNGQTDGQVNRLKLLKRQMYGRANFDLLRLRAIHAGLST